MTREITLNLLYSKQTKQKETHRYREQTDGCQMRGLLGDWEKKVKGLRSTDWQLQNSHGGIKYSTGNTVNNIVTNVLYSVAPKVLRKLYCKGGK